MRLIDLNEEKKRSQRTEAELRRKAGPWPRFWWTDIQVEGARAAAYENRIQALLAEGSIGWSEPLKFELPDAYRSYPPAIPAWRDGDFAGPLYEERA